MILGVHTIDNGGIDMAARRAAAAGFNAVQIFTAIPKFYGDKSRIKPERVERLHAALDDVGIPRRNVQVHAAYVLNVASEDETKGARAAAGLAKEMERSTAIEAGGVCFHPGSAKDGLEPAAERVAAAVTAALRSVDGATKLMLENTAGAGSTFGRNPEELGAVLERLPDDVRGRAGYGLDTCHLYASGYDIAESEDALRRILDAFEQACGQPPSFFHLNDSEGALGSNRDRHTLIGKGRIGVEPFGWLLRDPRASRVPLVLETPEQNYDVAEDDASGDPWDREMAELLRGLGAG